MFDGLMYKLLVFLTGPITNSYHNMLCASSTLPSYHKTGKANDLLFF